MITELGQISFNSTQITIPTQYIIVITIKSNSTFEVHFPNELRQNARSISAALAHKTTKILSKRLSALRTIFEILVPLNQLLSDSALFSETATLYL